MTPAKPWRAAVWLPIIVVLGAIAYLLVPALPGLADTTRAVVQGERLSATTASFDPAEGWTLDLDSAVSNRPEITTDGVVVRLSDGVWFGSSSNLIARMGELLEQAGARVESLPEAPTDDALITTDPNVTPNENIPRTEYYLDFTMGEQRGTLLVVRQDASVALLRVMGETQAIADHQVEVDAMFASVDVGVVGVDDVPTEPRVLEQPRALEQPRP